MNRQGQILRWSGFVLLLGVTLWVGSQVLDLSTLGGDLAREVSGVVEQLTGKGLESELGNTPALGSVANSLHAGTVQSPESFVAATPADAINYWNTRPTLAVLTSLILTFAALGVALLMPNHRRLAMILITITVLRHLYWRTFYTLDFEEPVSATIGVLLYLAEIYGLIAILLGCFQMYRPIWRDPPDAMRTEGFIPAVDVMIPTYSEPIDVLRRTIVGCLSLDYPNKRVLVLDDGKREEVRKLCRQLGADYITRPDNSHAKAGNLNHALAQTAGTLVVVFDADHVPVQSFLKRTVGHFVDKKLAFVQTPQHFCTPDPFQRNLVVEKEIANEQDLFYHVILPGVDSLGAVTFAGSGTVFRRQALEEIGGFAVETVTEDIHTGLRLHDLGWRSIYVNEDLAAGLAPETFEDFVNQRIRWAQGATQVFILENLLHKRGLTLAQKLSYFNALWYFLHGVPRLIFLLAPLAYLLFDIVVIQAYYLEVMTYYACYFLVSSVAYTQMSGRVRQTQWSELYETALCFHVSLITILTFLNPYDAKFKVTPKGKHLDQRTVAWGTITPHLLLLALTLAGLGMGLLKAMLAPETFGIFGWNLFWCIYNLVLLGCTVLVAVNRPQKRKNPRVPRQIHVEVKTPFKTARGVTVDLSEGGTSVILDEPVPVKTLIELSLLDWPMKQQTHLTCKAVRSFIDADGKHHLSLQFLSVDRATREQLIRHTFTAPETWYDYHQASSPVQSLLRLLETPIRWYKAKEYAFRRLAPRFAFDSAFTLLDEAGNLLALGSVVNISETGVSLSPQKIYRGLPPYTQLRLRMSWPGDLRRVVSLPVQILRTPTTGGPNEDMANQAITLVFKHLKPEDASLLQGYLYTSENIARYALTLQDHLLLEARRRRDRSPINRIKRLLGMPVAGDPVLPANLRTTHWKKAYVPFDLNISFVRIERRQRLRSFLGWRFRF